MRRIRGTYIGEPGLNSHLSEDGIKSEGEWHDAFERRMEEAGWALKHEVVRNDGSERADFLAYHDALNSSYDSGRWIGFELKYSDYDHNTRAREIAAQIEGKYLDGSWLSSGESVDMWVVAPYVELSHTGDPEGMRASRHRELEAADILSQAGFGYLNSWYPTPYIQADRVGGRVEAFPRLEEWVRTPSIPAFSGVFDSWKHGVWHDHEVEEDSELCRYRQMNEHSFTHDLNELYEIRQKYHGGGGDE